MENKSPTRLKKEELKDILMSSGYTKKELSNLKRPKLLELYESDTQGQSAEIALETVEVVTDNTETTAEEVPTKDIPTRSDPEWTQYVLGKLLDDELDGENPRVEGLRRVARDLIGTIVEEDCELIASPTVENGMRACVKAWVIFYDGHCEQKFAALADACPANITGEEFAIYLTAMADTRAKGRCFRNALGLKRVVSAEEISKKTGLELGNNSESAIHTGQITAIRMISDRLNVSLSKLLDDMGVEYQKSDSGSIDMSSLKHDQAVLVLQNLNKLQIEQNVPDELRV